MKIKIILNFFAITCFFESSPRIKLDIYMPTLRFECSYPYITGCDVRSIADFIYDPITSFNPQDINAGDVIFTMVDLLDEFFAFFHPKIKHPYILITHHFFGESDDPIPGVFKNYLDDTKLAAWFTINPDTTHPKLHPMPIGIPNARYSEQSPERFASKDALAAVIEKYKNTKHEKLVYVNFSLETPKDPTERKDLFFNMKAKKFATVAESTPPEINLFNIANHRFVLSPRGNGLDCFRTWEALLLGTFPVVKSSPLDSLFEDLPVVIINDWSEINEEFLEAKYIELKDKNYNRDKLYMPYWINKIKEIQLKYR